MHEKTTNTQKPTALQVRSRRRMALSVAFATALSLTTAIAGAVSSTDTSKCDDALKLKIEKRETKGVSLVIVRLNGPLTEAKRARLTRLNCFLYRELPIIHSVALKVPNANLSKLEGLDFVNHISLDGVVRKNDSFTDSNSMATAAWANLAATRTRLNLSQVVVGILDSGVNPVPDLPNIPLAVSFATGDPSSTDYCGHGTDVAGILCGNGHDSTGPNFTQTITGVASNPGAGALNLVSLKVLNAQGEGLVSDVIAAMSTIQLAVSGGKATLPQLPANARFVLNMSIGHPVGESYTTDPLCQACESLSQMGVVIVCAAGNNGRITDTQGTYTDNEGYGTNYGSINSPANDPYVITVGAMKNIDSNRSDDTIATYSSRGPTLLDYVMKPDIVAPGNDVISTDGTTPTGPRAVTTWLDQTYPSIILPPSSYWSGRGPSPTNQPGYITLSGTSMATPVVTAAAAMMLAENPTLSPSTVKLRLMATADKWTAPNGVGDPCTYGAGYVDIAAAMNSTLIATQPAESPILTEDSSGDVTIANMSGQMAIWGSNLTDLHAIWGKMAVDQNGTLASSYAIWGKSVWLTDAMFGVQEFQADFSSHVINGEGK